MADSWKTLETRLGRSGLESLVDQEVKPHLVSLAQAHQPDIAAKAMKSVQRTMSYAFFGFVVLFAGFAFLVPDTWWSVPLKFVLFPVMFFAAILAGLWLERKNIAFMILKAQQNFIARSTVLKVISDHLGLTYVPSPGGAPQSLKVISKFGVLKEVTDPIIETLDHHGGMDHAVDVAIDSGLLVPDTLVLGSEKDKARFYRQTALGHVLEDGFEGERNGVRFSALEWIEKVEDEADKYHLLLVLSSPHRLSGVTQLRSRKTPWPKRLEEVEYQPVQLVPESFNEKFRLRGSDQVEARTLFNPAVVERVLALAHGDTFRAVASGKHLLLDIVGDNRFNLVELHSGEWSDDSIRQTLTDIADLLDFVDVCAKAFDVKT